MKILLIDDDQLHRSKYETCIEYLPYPVELEMANGCKRGLELVQNMQPDIILLDLELHEADGDGILFLNTLKTLHLSQIPYIIVITINSSPRVHRTARRCGMDYIFIKSKPDYSPRLVLDFAHTYFVNQAEEPFLKSAALQESTPEEKIGREIEKIGITNGMSGKSYIVDAILIILNLYSNNFRASDISLTGHIYSVLARKYKKSDKSIEQGIRNAIKKAWLITDVDTLVENYTAVVSYRTGFPENRDFLFFYANKWRDKYQGMAVSHAFPYN